MSEHRIEDLAASDEAQREVNRILAGVVARLLARVEALEARLAEQDTINKEITDTIISKVAPRLAALEARGRGLPEPGRN